MRITKERFDELMNEFRTENKKRVQANEDGWTNTVRTYKRRGLSIDEATTKIYQTTNEGGVLSLRQRMEPNKKSPGYLSLWQKVAHTYEVLGNEDT